LYWEGGRTREKGIVAVTMRSMSKVVKAEKPRGGRRLTPAQIQSFLAGPTNAIGTHPRRSEKKRKTTL